MWGGKVLDLKGGLRQGCFGRRREEKVKDKTRRGGERVSILIKGQIEVHPGEEDLGAVGGGNTVCGARDSLTGPLLINLIRERGLAIRKGSDLKETQPKDLKEEAFSLKKVSL